MHAPWQIEPKSLADYLEVLTKSVFQAGISWRVVEAKADGIREAFAGFDPETVASLSGADIERLMYVIGRPVPPHEEWMAEHPARERAHAHHASRSARPT